MSKKERQIDQTDSSIVRFLQNDCQVPLDVLARKLRIPKSTLHYRIKRLEKEGVIDGYYAKVNALKLGYDYVAIVLVKARYGPRYHERVGRKIASIPGVWAIYYVLGDFDFIVLIRAMNRDDYMSKLEQLSSMNDIERTSTQIAAKIVKEDPRVDL
jgi:Lrp/AsnC family leucine-responsive transcriptional regulator